MCPVSPKHLFNISFRKLESLRSQHYQDFLNQNKIIEKSVEKKKRSKYFKAKKKRQKKMQRKQNYIKYEMDKMKLNWEQVDDVNGVSTSYGRPETVQNLLALQARLRADFRYEKLRVDSRGSSGERQLEYDTRAKAGDFVEPNWRLVVAVWNDCVKFDLVDFSLMDRLKPAKSAFLMNDPRHLFMSLKWGFAQDNYFEIEGLMGKITDNQMKTRPVSREVHLSPETSIESFFKTRDDSSRQEYHDVTCEQFYRLVQTPPEIRGSKRILLAKFYIMKSGDIDVEAGRLFLNPVTTAFKKIPHNGSRTTEASKRSEEYSLKTIMREQMNEDGYMEPMTNYGCKNLERLAAYFFEEYKIVFAKVRARVYREMGFVTEGKPFEEVEQGISDDLELFYFFCEFFKEKVQGRAHYDYENIMGDLEVFVALVKNEERMLDLEDLDGRISAETLQELLSKTDEKGQKMFVVKEKEKAKKIEERKETRARGKDKKEAGKKEPKKNNDTDDVKKAIVEEKLESKETEKKKEKKAYQRFTNSKKEEGPKSEGRDKPIEKVEMESIMQFECQSESSCEEWGQKKTVEIGKMKHKQSIKNYTNKMDKKTELGKKIQKPEDIIEKKREIEKKNEKKEKKSETEAKLANKTKITSQISNEKKNSQTREVKSDTQDTAKLTKINKIVKAAKKIKPESKETKDPKVSKSTTSKDKKGNPKKQNIKLETEKVVKKKMLSTKEELPKGREIWLGQNWGDLDKPETLEMHPKKLAKEKKKIIKEIKKHIIVDPAIVKTFFNGREVFVELHKRIPYFDLSSSDFKSNKMDCPEYSIYFENLDKSALNIVSIEQKVPMEAVDQIDGELGKIPPLANILELHRNQLFPMSEQIMLNFALKRNNQFEYSFKDRDFASDAPPDLTRLVAGVLVAPIENGLKLMYYHPGSSWDARGVLEGETQAHLKAVLAQKAAAKITPVRSVQVRDNMCQLELQAYQHIKGHYLLKNPFILEDLEIRRPSQSEYLQKFKLMMTLDFYQEFLNISHSRMLSPIGPLRNNVKKNRSKRFKKLVSSMGIAETHLTKQLISLFNRDNEKGLYQNYSVENLKQDFKIIEKSFVTKLRRVNQMQIKMVAFPERVNRILELDCENELIVYQMGHGADWSQDKLQSCSRGSESEYLLAIRDNLGIVKRVTSKCPAVPSPLHVSCAACKDSYRAVRTTVKCFQSVVVDPQNFRIFHNFKFETAKKAFAQSRKSRQEKLRELEDSVEIDIESISMSKLNMVNDNLIKSDEIVMTEIEQSNLGKDSGQAHVPEEMNFWMKSNNEVKTKQVKTIKLKPVKINKQSMKGMSGLSNEEVEIEMVNGVINGEGISGLNTLNYQNTIKVDLNMGGNNILNDIILPNLIKQVNSANMKKEKNSKATKKRKETEKKGEKPGTRGQTNEELKTESKKEEKPPKIKKKRRESQTREKEKEKSKSETLKREFKNIEKELDKAGGAELVPTSKERGTESEGREDDCNGFHKPVQIPKKEMNKKEIQEYIESKQRAFKKRQKAGEKSPESMKPKKVEETKNKADAEIEKKSEKDDKVKPMDTKESKVKAEDPKIKKKKNKEQQLKSKPEERSDSLKDENLNKKSENEPEILKDKQEPKRVAKENIEQQTININTDENGDKKEEGTQKEDIKKSGSEEQQIVEPKTILEAKKYISAKNGPQIIMMNADISLDSRNQKGNKLIRNVINGPFFNEILQFDEKKGYSLEYKKTIEVRIQDKGSHEANTEKFDALNFIKFLHFGKEIDQVRHNTIQLEPNARPESDVGAVHGQSRPPSAALERDGQDKREKIIKKFMKLLNTKDKSVMEQYQKKIGE